MIQIYDIEDKLLLQAEITSAAKREQEMSKSDYISLSFSTAEKVILPVGAYINYTYKIDKVREVTRKFLLLEAYEPSQTDEMSWKYTPEFQHPKMILSKTPFYIYTRNSQNEEIKQNIWSFVGTTSVLSGKIADFLNKDLMFGECGWKVIFSNVTANTVNVSFSDNDFISALTAITNAIGDNCEWHIDYDDEIIYIGKVLIGATPVILEVGKNVGVPNISNSKESYYNAFSIFGGTRNITQVNSKGENVSSGDIRLQLDEGNGTILIDGKERSYSIDKYSTLDLRADKMKEPLFTKVLDFSQIYPSLNTYVYNVRGRVKYVLDDKKKKIPISYNADGSVKEYKTFTVWYMRLAYLTTEKVEGKTIINTTVDDGVTHYCYDFEVTDDLLINGKNIGCSFEPNFNTGALSTPLAGRGSNGDYVGFELIYHKDAISSHTSDDVDKNPFSIKKGDYEIIYQEDNDIIIPTNAAEMLIPRGESKPSLRCNITVLYNIAMADTIYYKDAQNRLLEKAKEEIVRLLSDLNNYEIKSYSDVFLKENPELQIGQSVTYKDGHGYELATRVLKLSTNIDFGFIQTITLGNQVIKGTITQLKEDVQSIIASGGSNGNGGGFTVSQLRNLIAKYGSDNFISKQFDDTAQGLITFLKGLKSQDVIKAINGISLGNGENYVNGNGDAKLTDVVVDRIHDKNSTPSDRTIIGAQGFDLYMGDDGKSHLYVDYLTARTRMFASSVEIRKVSYSGGTTIFSNAGSQIAKVSSIYDAAKEKVIAYKCYAVADDGTTKTMNWWHVGMMALCQTFNIKAGENKKLANRYYWRMVVGVGQEKIEGKLYDYVILSNIKEFQGNLLTIPTYSDKTLANEQKKKLVWGNVMVEVTMDEGMQTLASLFAEQEGTDVDDNGTKIADRIFYGYDGEKPDAPAPYDVIVQVGDQIQWKKYGNIIKLSTFTEDSATYNAPAITMYHKLGAPHYTGSLDTNDNKIVNPYQWKIITTIISPEKVMHNTDNFQLFQGTPDNIIDPITIMYDIVPSVTYYTRHPSTQTTTPTDITFTLHKRTGNKIETLDDAQIYAEYTLLNGSSNTKLLPNKALSDIGDLYQITSVKLKSTIKEADHEDIVVTYDLPVLTDGVKGDQGAAGKDGTNGRDGVDGKDGINGTNGKDGIDGKDGKTPTVVSTTYQYAITATSAKPADSEWKSVMPDPSKYEGKFLWTKTTTTWSTGDKTDTFSCTYIGTDGADGTSVTIKGTLGSISELPTTGKAGDSYIIGGFLWVYAGTTTEDSNNHNGYTNVGKIKGEDGKSATQYYIHTAWMKDSDGTGFMVANPNGDAYPYVGTLVDANEKDSTNWRDYKWTYVKGDTGSKGDKGDKGDQGLPGVDGAPGANGKDGEDAINIVVKDIPMVFDTEDNGLVVDGAVRYASIFVYHKKENISSQLENVAVNSTENCECEVAYNSVRNCLRAKVYKVAKEDITVDGATTQISKTAGYATIRFSYNGVMYYQQVQFVVNVSKFNSSVIQTTKKYEQKYTEVSNQVGTLNTNLNNLQDDVDSLDKQVTAIPIRSDQDLTTFESKITQTAREISLSLTEKAVSRRNLLVNSDFARDSGISIFLQNKTITERLSGYEGSNCIHLFASDIKSYPILRWEGGNAKCNNIPIVAGKKYTISCWAKVTDVKAPLYVKVFGQSALTGNDATSISATGTLLDEPVPLKAANTWQLVSVTFVASGGYSYCSVRLFYRPNTNGHIDGYICRPMLEQSDSYNGWTLSEEDYNYQGGNMLDNTRYLNTGGNLTQVGLLIGNAKDGCSLSEATVQQNKSATLVRFDNVSVAANTDYVLSFFVRSKFQSSKTNVVCTLNLVTNAKFAECSSGSVSTMTSANGNSTTSGYIELGNIPTEWTKVWYHFSAHNTVTNQAIAIQMYGRNGAGTLQVCQPKLEAGLMNTPWTEATEDVANKDALKRTGIDIELGKITLDAENTIITGDLLLRGILVEYYEDLSANDDLFIVCDMKAHKSVTVSHSRVILPMLDTHTIKDYNDKEYTVNGLKKAGVKLTIASKYNSYVAKWAQTTPSLFESYKNFDNRGLMKTYHNYASVVFADPRIADKGNYKIVSGIDTLVPTILPEGGGGYAATGYEGGVFVCNGRRGRALVLMPGQTLHLTSAIEYVNEKQVLIWYVDNSSDFTPLTKEVCFYSWDGYTYDHGFRSNGGNAFPMEVSGSSGSEYEDAIFGTKILDETNLNGSLHAYWGGFLTGYSD